MNDLLQKSGGQALNLNPLEFGTPSQLAFIVEHCTVHPDDAVYDAGMALYTKLRRISNIQ